MWLQLQFFGFLFSITLHAEADKVLVLLNEVSECDVANTLPHFASFLELQFIETLLSKSFLGQQQGENRVIG